MQLAHLAPTYAAVNALAAIGTETAYNVIRRCREATFVAAPQRCFSAVCFWCRFCFHENFAREVTCFTGGAETLHLRLHGGLE
jgi:hypothetical protein